ncbi:septal ring lytic transglycosylase RlpA family protein [uncultured Flavobacterium sp.]|uniref:septal ring lytic transglycosylase RlpA family protein n=1 Tax=uncultured Flavobacterium sp. TaxID=165435 RepID=UPI0030CA52BE|tara:strand:+ start:806 stop:1291 length:486 start_codon:yes stop_codon:yes gene_type:complete
MRANILTFFLFTALIVYTKTNYHQNNRTYKAINFSCTNVLDTIKAQDSLIDKTLISTEEPYYKKAKASYYSDKLTGKKTASGSIFNNSALTCAHKTLKFGTKLKITGHETGKIVYVTVTDRGPFVKGRDLDLSKKAFMLIAPKSYGSFIFIDIEIIKDKIK